MDKAELIQQIELLEKQYNIIHAVVPDSIGNENVNDLKEADELRLKRRDELLDKIIARQRYFKQKLFLILEQEFNR